MTSSDHQPPAGLHPRSPPVPVVVLADFGRDASIRFCAELSRCERARVIARLPAGSPFYDEYRRITLSVVGDLPFAKQPQLETYRRSGAPLDRGVLVGFPGGPAPDEVAARLGVLLLEALSGPVRRGMARAIVALPCNTLAPVAWALDCGFTDEASLVDMLADAGAADRRDLRDIAAAVTEMSLEFPTVPHAALREIRAAGASAVLPLGTAGIVETYERARRRLPRSPEVVAPDDEGQGTTLAAIQACIGGDDQELFRAAEALRAVVDRAGQGISGELTAVEACTDLTLGVGLDSNAAYARFIVESVYGEEPR